MSMHQGRGGEVRREHFDQGVDLEFDQDVDLEFDQGVDLEFLSINPHWVPAQPAECLSGTDTRLPGLPSSPPGPYSLL